MASAVDTLATCFSFENFRIGQQNNSNDVAIFHSYMGEKLLQHNPWWLKNSPSWCKDIHLSNDALADKATEYCNDIQNIIDPNAVACPLEISVSEIFGRHLVANRDILPGEMLLVEPPLVLTFKPKSPPYCSLCLKKADAFNCPSCGFYFCGPECITETHKEECLILQRLGFADEAREKQRDEQAILERISTMSPDQQAQGHSLLQQARASYALKRQFDVIQMYVVIPLIRTLIAMSQSELLRDITLTLQGNVDENSQRYRMNQKRIIDVVTNKLKVPIEASFAHQLCSIWDTNGFEVATGWGTRVHGIYPFASLITHDCYSNTQQWFTRSGKLVLRAVDHISKGQIITTCYTDPRWATMIRQDHLKVSKQFTCTCSRCTDQTEFGTFLGSILCPNCGGLMISKDPLNSTADWICNKGCSHIMTTKEVASVGSSIGTEVKDVDPNDFERINNVADNLKSKLHPTHHILTQLHISNLSNLAIKDVSKLTDDELINMASIASIVMKVVSRLEAPYSRLRVRMAREDIRLRLEILRRENDKNPKSRNELEALLQQVRDCKLVMGWDTRLPSFTPVLQDYQNLINPHV